MTLSRFKILIVILIIVFILAIADFFVLQSKINFENKSAKYPSGLSKNLVATVNPIIPLFPQKLSNPPEIIKAVYVTGYSAGSKKYLNYLSNLFKNTEINAVVIDIKDYSGLVSYNSNAADVKKYDLTDHAIPDIDALVRFFHDKNIYVIARIVVFEDPAFSRARPDLAIYDKANTTDLSKPILWQDNNGLSWLDPASKDVWDYNISLAKDAFKHGFDEVNFDYVRFPSDGKTKNMGFPIWDGKRPKGYPKAEVIKEFFQYTRQQLAGEKISIDLFGQTTTSTDDMGIGQVIENAFENFDYISPMVYPSHYVNGFMGFSNPAEHPYEVIKYSMDTARARQLTYSNLLLANNDTSTLAITPLAKFRPWLQDFNIGAYYTSEMVKSEIKATQDSLGNDFNGFMLWNPSNIYTQEATLKPN